MHNSSAANGMRSESSVTTVIETFGNNKCVCAFHCSNYIRKNPILAKELYAVVVFIKYLSINSLKLERESKTYLHNPGKN